VRMTCSLKIRRSDIMALLMQQRTDRRQRERKSWNQVLGSIDAGFTFTSGYNSVDISLSALLTSLRNTVTY
jgi:hypothetical protein